MGLFSSGGKFKWGGFFITLALCVAGILILSFPGESFTVVSYIVATCCCLTGIFLFGRMIAKKEQGMKRGLTILFSIFTIICGITAFIFPDKVIGIYPMFIGLFVVLDGAFTLQILLKAKGYMLKAWWFLIFLAGLTIFFGFVSIRTQATEKNIANGLYAFIFGMTVFVCGLHNLFALLFLRGVVSKMKGYSSEEKPKPKDKHYDDEDDEEEYHRPRKPKRPVYDEDDEDDYYYRPRRPRRRYYDDDYYDDEEYYHRPRRPKRPVYDEDDGTEYQQPPKPPKQKPKNTPPQYDDEGSYTGSYTNTYDTNTTTQYFDDDQFGND